MCVSAGGGAETPARKGDFHMKTQSKPEAGASASASGRMVAGRTPHQAASPAKKKVVANQPKVAVGMKAGKAARRPPRSARVTAETKKLVCRYCGSDDLAPSFLKRRDARCRACFKQRYGSAARDTKATHTRQAKAK
jgi:hypothetical protein